MKEVWVDTDFGFDDLWALLLLRHLGCEVGGVSLVAGNAPLPQVAGNAVAAKAAYGFSWPVWQGAARPLAREPETAARILGPTGMRSRGRQLELSNASQPPEGAIEALSQWLRRVQNPEVLALGPLTNIASLLAADPDSTRHLRRLVWMGGSAGAGNHTPMAEYNAVADPEALEVVLSSGITLDIVDLTFCRQVQFGPEDLPDADPLTSDLLGGYLDIGLSRGRAGMAIYDPLAAIAIAQQDAVVFDPHEVTVSTVPDETYGATRMSPAPSQIRVATDARRDLKAICLAALSKEVAHAS